MNLVSSQRQNLNIIAVDDNRFMLRQLEVMLQQCGIAQLEAHTDGEQALDSLSSDKSRHDLLFLDLNMPQPDGIEVLRRLSQLPQPCPVVLLSGESPSMLHASSQLAGAQRLAIIDHVAKPLNRAQLERILVRLERHNTLQPNTSTATSLSLADLKQAIRDQWLECFYQPQFSAHEHQAVGFEMLARLRHPEAGLISPGVFIPLAEQHGLIHQLTLALMEQSFHQLSVWQQQGYSPHLSLNLSTQSLSDIQWPDQLKDWVQRYNIAPERITLEVTESELLHQLPRALDVLIRLRLKGFGLSIDDFGTGYSSLQKLDQVPFTELKIDRSFVQDCDSLASRRNIVQSTIELAKRLQLTTVAEGVETRAELAQVEQLQVDRIQGFCFCRPLPVEDLTQFLQQPAQAGHSGD